MKYLILLSMFSFVGCNTLNKLVNGNQSKQQEANIAPQDYTVTGTTVGDNDFVSIRVINSDIIVKVLRSNETSWVTLNKYEFNKDNSGKIIFRHKATINPNGSLTFKSPEEPVAPKGTHFEVRSVEKVTDKSLY